MLAAPPCLRFPTWCERKTIIIQLLGGFGRVSKFSNLNSAAYITQLQSHSSTCLCMKFDVKLSGQTHKVQFSQTYEVARVPKSAFTII